MIVSSTNVRLVSSTTQQTFCLKCIILVGHIHRWGPFWLKPHLQRSTSSGDMAFTLAATFEARWITKAESMMPWPPTKHMVVYIWIFPKIGVPPNHPF